MECVLPECHQPGQWPLTPWKCALRSGGSSQQGQGTQTEKGRVYCRQVQSCFLAHGWTTAHRHPVVMAKLTGPGIEVLSLYLELTRIPRGSWGHPHFTDKETEGQERHPLAGGSKRARTGLSESSPTLWSPGCLVQNPALPGRPGSRMLRIRLGQREDPCQAATCLLVGCVCLDSIRLVTILSDTR